MDPMKEGSQVYVMYAESSHGVCARGLLLGLSSLNILWRPVQQVG